MPTQSANPPPISKVEQLTITPDLQKRIDEARKAFAEGKCIECRTPEELEKLFDSL